MRTRPRRHDDALGGSSDKMAVRDVSNPSTLLTFAHDREKVASGRHANEGGLPMRKRLYTGLIGIPVILVVLRSGFSQVQVLRIRISRTFRRTATGRATRRTACRSDRVSATTRSSRTRLTSSTSTSTTRSSRRRQEGRAGTRHEWPAGWCSRADQRPRWRDQIHARLCSAVGDSRSATLRLASA